MLDEALDEMEGMEEAPEASMAATGEQILFAIMQMPNIADALAMGDPKRLADIAAKVVADYEIDEESRKQWLERNDEAMKLAMLASEQKNYPFENSANVKYPLLTTAALQFNARAYPAIVAPDAVVKCKVRGRDDTGIKAARASRVSEFMSDQLLNEMKEWDEDTDRLLIMLPIVGSVFRKVWRDPALGRNRSRLVTARDFVVNFHGAALGVVPRCTEIVRLYPYEIEERIRDGRFSEFDYKNLRTGADQGNDKSDVSDDNAPHVFLEQHRLIDLDEDGYPEPYIVTVHKDSNTCVRVVANFDQDGIKLTPDRRIAAITRQDYYVHYQFMPNPESGFYGLGFGWLLSSTNEVINSTLNQLLDAGHMANMQGGLVSAVLGTKEKSIRLERGEWRVINTGGAPINTAIAPIKYGEPSSVLFSLLGLMIESGKEVAAVKDVLTGEGMGKNASPTTTLALIEQGLQVFTSIYKRIHRTLKHELAIYARLNAANLTREEYANFCDDPSVDPKADFNAKDMDILPVSDPQNVTKMQKLAKAQFVYETSKENPLINPEVATRRILEAADVEDVDDLIVQPPQPDPAEVAFMKAMRDLELQDKVAEVKKKLADGMKSIADAESKEAGSQVGFYRLVLETLLAEVNAEQQANAGIGPGGVSSMAGAPMDAPGAGALPQPGIAGPGPVAAPVDGAIAGGPEPMGSPASAGGVPQGAL